MSKLKFKASPTSVILRVKLMDSTSTSGAGKTGIAYNTSGLIIGTMKIGDATTTGYTQGTNSIESITTLGTYETPTTGKCRFKEVSSSIHPGIYELQLPNARFASTSQLLISITCGGVAEFDCEVDMEEVDANALEILGTAISTPATAGVLDVNVKNIANAAVSTSSAQIGVNVIQAAGTAWGSGAITAGSIASNAIAAAKIATGAITSAKFAAGAIDAAAIATDAIDADSIKADAVTKIQAGLSTVTTAQVNAEVDTALADIKLDHLVAVAESGDVVNSSIIAKMASKSAIPAFSSFDNTTDSLEAISDASGAGTIDANLVSINGDSVVGNAATLTLKQLDVQNNAGSALIVKSTGGNGKGIDAAGHGTGDGVFFKGGDTGNGMAAHGGATSGHGIDLYSYGNTDASTALEISAQAQAALRLKANAIGGTGVAPAVYIVQMSSNPASGVGFYNASAGGKNLDAAELGTPLNLDGTGASLAGNAKDIFDNLSSGTVDANIVTIEGADATDVLAAQAQVGAAAALTAYDPPTKAELDSAVAPIGTPVSLDGGAATLAAMLTKMADDNDGADFNASTDSLERIATTFGDAITLDDTVDGVTVSLILQKLMAMADGKFLKNTPSANAITFYKRDGSTPLFVVEVVSTGRNRLVG